MSGLCLSVSMCTYNGARFLREQLESIASQIRLPDELVVCDDGSTDATLAILTEYAKAVRFPVRIQCNTSRLGPAKNFEQAISLCKGEIIVLSDQDDIACISVFLVKNVAISVLFCLIVMKLQLLQWI